MGLLDKLVISRLESYLPNTTSILRAEMTKLNQIVAVEKGVKAAVRDDVTKVYHKLQKPVLLAGISRKYQPKNDEGETLPEENTKVQLTADQVLYEASKSFTRLFDVTATKDFANTKAKASVVVDGNALVLDAPVPYLLFLEKQLTDLHTFVTKLPVLDPSETWTFDSNAGAFRADTVETTRTKKVPRNHVKAEATDRHPAQVELYYEDVVVGTWATTKFSGALPGNRVRDLLDRVEKVQEAVKFAREEANVTEVDDKHVGQAVFDYLFEA